jgi:arylsulfatase A-like enzyme
MTQRTFLVVIFIIVSQGAIGLTPNAAERPNILLIVSEDNGPELGCYGDPFAQTPVLDKLAERGVRFENAFVPYSVCSPSRACFLTGLYPHQNGQIGLATHKFAMFDGTSTLPAILKQHGYRTGIIGKLHVSPESAFPFDFRRIASANFGKRDVREYASAAADFFKQDSDEPFFLSINYPDAHFPLHRQQFGLPKKPISAEDVRPLPWVGVDSPRLREFTANYYNCLRRLDDGIGMLLEELNSSGHADNTLVVYIGDHGAQFSRGKCSVYEAGLRIPMIVRWPGNQLAGTVRTELASTLDLVPTFLTAAGIEVPENLPGHRLQPLLKNGPAPQSWRQHIVGFTAGAAPGIFYLQQSIRDEHYKLISNPLAESDTTTSLFAQAYLKQYNSHFAAGCTADEIATAPASIQKAYDRFLNPPRHELYDLASDPYEFTNLADSSEHAEIKARLIAAFNQWQRDTADPFADEEKLTNFTRSQLEAIGTNYRTSKSFRWPYLSWKTSRQSSVPTAGGESAPSAEFTGFESPKAGGFTKLTFDNAIWRAPAGQAEILAKLARTGRQCLHLRGGKHSQVEFALSHSQSRKKYDLLSFAAERWTKRAPFQFRVEAAASEGEWKEIYNGDQKVKVGRAYLNNVAIPLPPGVTRFRMTCTSPPNAGVLIDDMTLDEAKPMAVSRVAVLQETAPALIGQDDSPLLRLMIVTEGSQSPKKITAVKFALTEGVDAVRNLRFDGTSARPASAVSFETNIALVAGQNVFPLTCELSHDASLDQFVSATCVSIEIDGKTIKLNESPSIRRRVGVALRQRGQAAVHTYRIPGITTTQTGALIAVYDNRNRGGGDLPGDIDVGMSRSTDGGQSWEPMKVIMDMGDDPKWNYDGIGDPSILTDRVTGTIWVAATWSHGNRSWRGSGPGMTPEETGQLLLAKSTDDGQTWSKPINITSQVKVNPEWRFVLQGPGNGITLRDGTLVFPAQFRGEDSEPVNGKPFSTIIYSKDRGANWQIGSGVKIDTTEAQVVQLGDDSVMINCRDNRGGSRSVYTTQDLGQTWTEHPTSRKALPEPVCNADLLRVVHPRHGPLLFFSNPNTTRGRHHFTIKVSNDEGLTWPDKWHTLYDERPGSGYSTLTQIDDDHIGVLYEGPGELYFVRFSIDELLRSSPVESR